MNKKNIMIAFGTRPEAIKMCPLVRELKKHEQMHVKVCFSGQHKQMAASVMDLFGVRADFSFDVMKDGQSVGALVGKITEKSQKLLHTEKPDMVLVHGDTATSLAFAQSAFFERIPIGHVEAGLRSADIYAPFPEEYNRRSISLISDIHFAPTHHAATNLLEEGIRTSKVYVTGNTVIDALKYTVKKEYKHELLKKCVGKRIIFFTAHRRENRGQTLIGMFCAVKDICRRFPDVRVIFPVHPSSEVREIAERVFAGFDNVILTEPISVFDCHNILARSHIILTDSGGLQEEAAGLCKPVFVMRNVTERPEGILSGVARLAGTDREQISATITEILGDENVYKQMSTSQNPYGRGDACKKIADILQAI